MNYLIVSVPETYLPERNYILKVLLGEFLGLDYKVDIHKKHEVIIRMSDNSNRVLITEDILFHTPAEQWMKMTSLPRQPLPRWNVADDLPEVRVCDTELPILYGRPIVNGRYFYQQDDVAQLGLDIFGSSFFMLTRYEELALADRDEHERFPARSSLSYKEGFIRHPLVNEYLEVLWAAMKRLWPGLKRKQRLYRIALSHDVDWPFMTYGMGWSSLFRQTVGDLFKRHDFALALKRIWCKIRDDFYLDPANTFNFIMDLSERYGIISEFYFITDHTAGAIDGMYFINNFEIRTLMHLIYERGHRIGLHTSYNTFRDSRQTKKEFEYLLRVAKDLGIKQDFWGGRQHYLRWENPTTWQNWEDAGFDYDSTVGFADHVGFRAGVCYEYPVFNLLTRKVLRLRERPLIVMDGTLLEKKYMGLKIDEALSQIEHLASVCRLFNGLFTLLWHNSSLIASWQKRLYEDAVRIANKV